MFLKKVVYKVFFFKVIYLYCYTNIPLETIEKICKLFVILVHKKTNETLPSVQYYIFPPCVVKVMECYVLIKALHYCCQRFLWFHI